MRCRTARRSGAGRGRGSRRPRAGRGRQRGAAGRARARPSARRAAPASASRERRPRPRPAVRRRARRSRRRARPPPRAAARRARTARGRAAAAGRPRGSPTLAVGRHRRRQQPARAPGCPRAAVAALGRRARALVARHAGTVTDWTGRTRRVGSSGPSDEQALDAVDRQPHPLRPPRHAPSPNVSVRSPVGCGSASATSPPSVSVAPGADAPRGRTSSVDGDAPVRRPESPSARRSSGSGASSIAATFGLARHVSSGRTSATLAP